MAETTEGRTTTVRMHDGSYVRLHKLDDSYDPRNSEGALTTLRERYARGQVATGLLYIDEDDADLHGLLGTAKTPLNGLSVNELCPGSKALADINKSLR